MPANDPPLGIGHDDTDESSPVTQGTGAVGYVWAGDRQVSLRTDTRST